jgi:hypothetical protein
MSSKQITAPDFAAFIESAALKKTSITLNFAQMSLAETPVQHSKPATTFEGLPLELRENIYTLSMASTPSRVYIDSESDLRPLTFLPKVLPGICHVNKIIGQQAKIAWIRRTCFVMADRRWNPAYDELLRWFKQFPEGMGLQAVRMLMVSSSSLMTVRCMSETALQPFRGLRFLAIKLNPLALAKMVPRPDGQGKTRALKTKEELAGEFGQNAIFTAPALKTLRIYCEAHSIGYMQIDGVEKDLHNEELTVNLRQMLERGFADNGKKVNIDIDFNQKKAQLFGM